MSAQPFSRADRNRLRRGEPARVDGGIRYLVEVDHGVVYVVPCIPVRTLPAVKWPPVAADVQTLATFDGVRFVDTVDAGEPWRFAP